MATTLVIRIRGPIEDEDKAVLSGTAMLLFALANNGQMPENPTGAEAEEELTEDQKQAQDLVNELQAQGLLDPPPAPCGAKEPDSDRICAGQVGHRGRHLYRRFALAN